MFWAHIFVLAKRGMKTLFFPALITAILTLSSAWANDIPGLPEETRSLALKIGNQIETESLLKTQNEGSSLEQISQLPPQERLLKLRTLIYGATNQSNNFDTNQIVEKYTSLAQEIGTQRDIAVGELFSVISQNFDAENPHANRDNLDVILHTLEPFTSHPDWFVAQNAWLYKSLINSYYFNPSLALRQAETALQLIPDELSQYASEARIEIIDHTAYLHNLMRNPTLGTQNTAKLIELKKASGQPIDGVNLLNNLVYAFNSWRDHETAGELVQILARIENHSGVPGLTQMRLAQTLIEQTHYKKAFEQIEAGLELAKVKTIRETLLILRVSALAGMGETVRAETALLVFENAVEDSDRIMGSTPQRILHAKALIALSRGDAVKTHALMNQRMDAGIQSILTANNAETVKFLASLENSKNRQGERENALRREALLRQAELEQKQKVNLLLGALSFIFAIAAITAVILARYRARVAKELEIAAKQAQAGEKSKSEFLAIMSHELRTPLNGIIGIADLLCMTAPNEDLKHKTSIILNSGNELLGLVENIMDMSRLEAGDIEIMKSDCSAKEIISRIDEKWRDIITQKDVIFTTHVDKSVPDLIYTDPKCLFQCIDNLVSNSVKFTKSGRIHVHVSAEPVKGTGNIQLKINVADTGAGITPEVQKRLFQPFVQADSSITRHFGGAGLGLAITRSLARLMNGDVSLVSNPNRGSEFTLTIQDRFKNTLIPLEKNTAPKAPPLQALKSDSITQADRDELETILEDAVAQTPLSGTIETTDTLDILAQLKPLQPLAADIAQEAVPAPEAAPTPLPQFPDIINPDIINPDIINIDKPPMPFTLIIVDDERANQIATQLMLNNTGYGIHLASNGQEAVEIMKLQNLDLVIMDIDMPIMDGITATKIIRNLPAPLNGVPIIALSAERDAQTHADALGAGINFILQKPLEKSELINAVNFFAGHDANINNGPQTETQKPIAYPSPKPLKALGL